MPDDRQLLRQFAADRSEAAFGELVARHVSLVYSAALRQTGGDAHLAQDIAQLVFADLARKAPALSENVVLAGWLHRATIFAARQILRGERRRRAREQEAVTMNAIQVAPAGLAVTLTNASLAVAGTGTTFTFLKIMTMTKLKLGISALIVAGATTALVVQHQAQTKLRGENESLRQQITQLQTDNENFSNRLANIGDAKKLSDDQFNELLKLRGEVGILRRQASNLEKLHDEDQRFQSQATVAQNQTEQFSPEDLFQLHQIHVVSAMKQIGLAARIYSGDNNGQYPTNFDQFKTELGGVTNFNGITLDSIEFVNAGLVNDTTPDKIMFREQTPRKDPNGAWERIYAFADGSVQTEYSDDGNFDTFEQQHMVSPPTNGQ